MSRSWISRIGKGSADVLVAHLCVVVFFPGGGVAGGALKGRGVRVAFRAYGRFRSSGPKTAGHWPGTPVGTTLPSPTPGTRCVSCASRPPCLGPARGAAETRLATLPYAREADLRYR